MEIKVLESKIFGILRRHRWAAFRWLSMRRLTHRSGGDFREVTIALINLEQASYIRWPDKSSLRHIVMLRKAYHKPKNQLLAYELDAAEKPKLVSPTAEQEETLSLQEAAKPRLNRRPTGTGQSSRRRQAAD